MNVTLQIVRVLNAKRVSDGFLGGPCGLASSSSLGSVSILSVAAGLNQVVCASKDVVLLSKWFERSRVVWGRCSGHVFPVTELLLLMPGANPVVTYSF